MITYLWYINSDKEKVGFHSFNVIAATFYEHYEDILNFYNKRSSNAAAESFNSKIKGFRNALRGIVDEKFFLFDYRQFMLSLNKYLLSPFLYSVSP